MLIHLITSFKLFCYLIQSRRQTNQLLCHNKHWFLDYCKEEEEKEDDMVCYNKLVI